MIVREINRENYISRVKGLFPYIKQNEDGEWYVHGALENPSGMGCYGEIVPNIKTPVDVDLYYYDTVEYQSDVVYTDIDSIYDICGQTDEQECLIDSDYLRISDVDFTGNTVFYYYKRVYLIKPDKSYSYRTLMDMYYKYKNNSVFKKLNYYAFLTKCIGFYDIDRQHPDLSPLLDYSVYDMIPEHVSFSEIAKLIEEMDTLKNKCSIYMENERIRQDFDFCCECEMYERMGGDVFREYLYNLKTVSETVSEELKDLVDNDGMGLSYNIDLLFNNSFFDVGVSEVYENRWVPGYEFRDGDLVTYNDRTYICTIEPLRNDFNELESNYLYNSYLYIEKYENNVCCLKKLQNDYTYENIDYVEVDGINLPSNNIGEYIKHNGSYYEYTNGYGKINVKNSTTGIYNNDTMDFEFDYVHFILLTEYASKTSQLSDFYSFENTNGWVYIDGDVDMGDFEQTYLDIDENTPFTNNAFLYKYFYIKMDISEITTDIKNKSVEFQTLPNINNITSDLVEYPLYITNNDDYYHKLIVIYKWDNESDQYIPYNSSKKSLIGHSDSKLKSLRRFVKPINFIGVTEIPLLYEDWLVYYKKGYICKYRMTYDSLGNINRVGVQELNEGDYVYDLDAYGDVITDIDYDEENEIISFVYRLGCHLKGKLAEIEETEEGDSIYKYSNFAVDETSDEYIEYKEFYSYHGCDELTELIRNGDFEKYVDIDETYPVFYHLNNQVDGTFTYVKVLTFVNHDDMLRSNVVEECYGRYLDGDVYKYWFYNQDSNSWDEVSTNTSDNIEEFNYRFKYMGFNILSNTTNTTVLKNGIPYNVNFRVSDYKYIKSNEVDFLQMPLYKNDVYLGVGYEPKVTCSVKVDKGNLSVRDKHIRFGEIKTFEDFENYSNGGYFSIKDD